MPEQVNQYTPKDKITNSLTNPPRPKNLKRLVILWVILLISSFREKLCCQEPGLKSSSLRAPPSALCQKLVWNEFGMSLEMSSDQLRALHGLVFFGRAQIFVCNAIKWQAIAKVSTMTMMTNTAFSLCIPPPLQLEPPGRKDLVGIFGCTGCTDCLGKKTLFSHWALGVAWSDRDKMLRLTPLLNLIIFAILQRVG